MYVPISPFFRMAMYFYAVYTLPNINIGVKGRDFRHFTPQKPQHPCARQAHRTQNLRRLERDFSDSTITSRSMPDCA